METIIQSVLSNIAATLILSLILLLLVAFLFARDKLGEFVIGVIRIFASIFYSPFIYLKNSILNLAEYATKGDTEFSKTRQYLLGKIMLLLEAVLVIITLVIFSASLVVGWKTMLPAEHITSAIDNLEESIDRNSTKLDEVTSKIEDMDKAWLSTGENAYKNYIDSLNNAKSTYMDKNEKLESQLSSPEALAYALERIKDGLSDYSRYGTLQRYTQGRNNIKSYSHYYHDVNDQQKRKLYSFIDNWYNVITAKFYIDNTTEASYRATLQPNYSSFVYEEDALKNSINSSRSQLERLYPDSRWRIEAMLLGILFGLLYVIVSVWLFGVLIESMQLGINAAMNIQLIKHHLDNKKE